MSNAPDGLTIRKMREQDIDRIASEFYKQQNPRPRAVYSAYLNQQHQELRTVLVALLEAEPAGFLTLLPQSEQGPFAGLKVPEITDLNVFERFRGSGIGSSLMDAVEAVAARSSLSVCLSVGLSRDYGPAQRLYAKRGYIPDGTGVWYKGRQMRPNDICFNDDDLLIYLCKELDSER